ncbi:MAG: hypothetical protein OEW12_04320 [Deltaproteobacteria bacterium]|nr:hypothetical protein [Deltaproteobacteria bacterium]
MKPPKERRRKPGQKGRKARAGAEAAGQEPQKERHQPAIGVRSRQATQRRAVLVLDSAPKRKAPASLKNLSLSPPA